ncbi:MAG: ACT domain-containing protein [Bacteroidetes bacterium]|nr:ACT domain-containing protein [Bacteroidota bacterium]
MPTSPRGIDIHTLSRRLSPAADWCAMVAACVAAEGNGERLGVWIVPPAVPLAQAIEAAGVSTRRVTAAAALSMAEPQGTGWLLVQREKHTGGGPADGQGPGRAATDALAARLASAWDADRVVSWTRTNDLYSADPDLVPEAFLLDRLTYREASEMAAFGRGGIHPRMVRLLQQSGIPLELRSLRREGDVLARIDAEGQGGGHGIRAIMHVPDVALVVLEGSAMVRMPGTAARAFQALAHQHINVFTVSLASSEQSLCIAVPAAEAARGRSAIAAAFAAEEARGDIEGVTVIEDVAIISAVGDNMRYRTGLSGQLFASLGRAGVNVLAISEGASEANISSIVEAGDLPRALQALHETFAIGQERVHLFLIGTGTVGGMLLEMLSNKATDLQQHLRLNLQLIGAANTRHMLWDVHGIPFDEVGERLAQAPPVESLDALIAHLMNSQLERLLVVDATASDAIAERYQELLDHNIGIITPNKRANTRSQAYYDALHAKAREQRVPYFYETTVGAGLPVISTLRTLVRTGDRIQRIQGVFSGTLAFLFGQLGTGVPFADAVREAMDRGLTEPDPREDLGGEDVARKLLILAREMGLAVERTDVTVESLVPPELAEGSVEAFLKKADTLNETWRERTAKAQADGERLLYLGTIADGHLEVGVRSVPVDGPFSALRGTDNVVIFETDRYTERPLVVQGPGAGPRVTAAGILADLIQAAELVA